MPSQHYFSIGMMVERHIQHYFIMLTQSYIVMAILV